MRFVKRALFVCSLSLATFPMAQSASVEAPAGFDDLTNGLVIQAQFDQDRAVFADREGLADGLGPVYNAQSCAECHQNPVTGAISQITEVRAGHFDARTGFHEHPGGSLIHDRAISAKMQERILPGYEVRSQRSSLNVLGDGYVESIADETIAAIARAQPASMRGQIVQVPVLEAGNVKRAGRFGWKNQHASLVSFSADAYLNEMGITSPLMPVDNTANGVVANDGIADPEDDGDDIEVFAQFMRATKAPPRDLVRAATPAAQAGASTFGAIGCAVCHVRSITTAPVGTPINGGAFVVPEALGAKVIHPFSDFMLHDVGTGDGIVQNGPPSTRNKLRTAPLWGLRTRNRLMHDGLSFTVNEAILRHAREADTVTSRYRTLPVPRRDELLAFLASL
jgi:CxxC motif-containing protein (DUF1111 family)